MSVQSTVNTALSVAGILMAHYDKKATTPKADRAREARAAAQEEKRAARNMLHPYDSELSEMGFDPTLIPHNIKSEMMEADTKRSEANKNGQK